MRSSNEIEMELKQKLLCLRLALGRLCGALACLEGDSKEGAEGCATRANEMCVNILIE